MLTREVLARAGALAAQTISPISDVRGSAEYRRYMTETITRHALEMLAEGTEFDALPPKPVMLWGSTNGHFPTVSDEESIVHTETADEPIATTINGEARFIHGANDKTLLRMLREDAGLIGTKEGCAEGECGACTVFLDGIAVMSCLVPAPRAHESQIVTLEGLANTQNTDTGGDGSASGSGSLYQRRSCPVWLLHPWLSHERRLAYGRTQAAHPRRN